MKKPKKTCTFRLDEITRERLKAIASETETSEAEVIQNIVEQYYKKHLKHKEKG